MNMLSQKLQPASTNLINISEPGSIPYVDIPTSNFGEILVASQDVAKRVGCNDSSWTASRRLQTDKEYLEKS